MKRSMKWLAGVVTIKGKEYSTELTRLYLSDNDLTNADIELLKYMTNLTTLNLSYNKISDISALKGLTNLAELYLNDNKISDISALKGLTNLETLYLHDNEISEAQIAELQAVLPNCSIYDDDDYMTQR